MRLRIIHYQPKEFSMVLSPPIFDIGEIKHGWAEMTIRHGEREHGDTISFLTDVPGWFLKTVVQIASRSTKRAYCEWEHEPGISTVIIEARDDWPLVELRIEGDEDIREGGFPFGIDDLVQLRAIIDIRDLARDVVSAFDRVLDRYGAEGYEQRWDAFPFPTKALEALRTWLAREEGH